MTEKKFKVSPFGTHTCRFDESGINPLHKRVGKHLQSEVERNRGPGTYDPETGDFSAHAVQKRAKGPGWKREQETARLTQRPRVQSRKIWENRLVIQTMLGPSRFDSIVLTDEIIKKVGHKHGLYDNKIQGFEDFKNFPPDTDISEKGWIPKAVLNKSEGIYTGTPYMDTDSDTPRSSFLNQNNVPGPDIYTLPTFIDELNKKPCSSKGGVCATGARRFVEPKRHTRSPRVADESLAKSLKVTKIHSKSLATEGTTETSMDNEKVPNGKKKQVGFGTEKRFPSVHTERIYLATLAQSSRHADFPGPGSYEVTSATTKCQTKSGKSAPFLTSTPRIKTTENNKNGHHQFNIKNTNLFHSGHRPLVISKILHLLQTPDKEKLQREQLVVIGVKLGRAGPQKKADWVTEQIAPNQHTTVPTSVSGQDR